MSEEFHFSNWISQGVKGIRDSIHLPSGKILPDSFQEHMKTSRKEFLLAFRSLFDVAIEQIDKPKTAGPRKATKIKVE